MITKEEIIALLGELPDDARIGGFVIVATKKDNMVSSSHLLDVEDCHGVCKHSIIKEVEEAVKEWRGGMVASGMSN